MGGNQEAKGLTKGKNLLSVVAIEEAERVEDENVLLYLDGGNHSSRKHALVRLTGTEYCRDVSFGFACAGKSRFLPLLLCL